MVRGHECHTYTAVFVVVLVRQDFFEEWKSYEVTANNT